MLSTTEKQTLLQLARQSIAAYIGNSPSPVMNNPPAALRESRAVFVSLHCDGRLRGCMGEMTAREKLWRAVVHNAISAASRDPRFSAITLAELAECDVEISALTPLKRTEDPLAIRLGVDGVYVKNTAGSKSGCYLPQVGERFDGKVEQFLGSICRDKAKLAEDAWRHEDTQVYTFQAEVFSENELR